MIARKFNFTRRSIRELMSSPNFDVMLKSQEGAIQTALERRVSYLGRLVDEATGVLEEALGNVDPKIAMKAATEILDREGSLVKQRRALKATVSVTMTGADLAKLKDRAENAYIQPSSVESVTAEVVDLAAVE